MEKIILCSTLNDEFICYYSIDDDQLGKISTNEIKIIEIDKDKFYNGICKNCVKDIDESNGLTRYIFKYMLPKSFDELKTDKLNEIAMNRFNNEKNGIKFNGITIPTDRESQALITGAALQAVLDENYICNWKTENGFIPLDAKTILGIASMVRQHVQACFDKEKELVDMINNATTIEELNDIKW